MAPSHHDDKKFILNSSNTYQKHITPHSVVSLQGTEELARGVRTDCVTEAKIIPMPISCQHSTAPKGNTFLWINHTPGGSKQRERRINLSTKKKKWEL